MPAKKKAQPKGTHMMPGSKMPMKDSDMMMGGKMPPKSMPKKPMKGGKRK